jgi:hypothetical protein
LFSTELESKALLGKGATDLYGRHLGRVIGIDKTPFGEMAGVQIEAVGGNILTAKTRQVALTPKTVTVTPEWKLNAHETTAELATLRKRIAALESLRDSREIDTEIFTELLEAQKEGYLDKVKAGQALVVSMKARAGELSSQISSLTKYLVHARLGHRSGEVDDESLKLAQESIQPSLRPLIAERNDLFAELESLQKILPARVEVSEAIDPS